MTDTLVMKMRRILPLFGIAGIAMLGVSLHAQTPTASPTPKAKTHLTYGALTPAQREELRIARETAEKNPAVIDALKAQNAAAAAFSQAMEAGALAEDPAIKPGLEKLHAAAHGTAWEKQEENMEWKRMRQLWKQQRAQGSKSSYFNGIDMEHSQDADDLTTAERNEIHAARGKARSRRGVIAAKRNFAQAKAAYDKVMRDAMITADPGVASILDQLGY